jgi:hypothetical protein
MNTQQAGWYADPQVPGQQRYWDGSAWTQNVQPAGGSPPQASPGGPPPQGQGAPTGTPAAFGPPKKSTGRRIGQIAAIVVAVLVVVGIALSVFGTKTIDANKLESKLPSKLSTPVKDVSCPDGEDAKKGNRFSCTVTLPDGSTQSVEIEVQNGDGDVLIVGP